MKEMNDENHRSRTSYTGSRNHNHLYPPISPTHYNYSTTKEFIRWTRFCLFVYHFLLFIEHRSQQYFLDDHEDYTNQTNNNKFLHISSTTMKIIVIMTTVIAQYDCRQSYVLHYKQAYNSRAMEWRAEFSSIGT